MKFVGESTQPTMAAILDRDDDHAFAQAPENAHQTAISAVAGHDQKTCARSIMRTT